MVKHTPGPWHNNRNQVYPEHGNGSTLAYVYSNDSDAQLIAAAPDMLAALQACYEHFAGTDAPLGRLAYAAIDKAIG